MKISKNVVDKTAKYLKDLQIYEPYIEGYKKEGEVCFFERYGGYWLSQEPEIADKRIELQNKYNIVIYAVTHEYTQFGEMWSFIYSTNNSNESDKPESCGVNKFIVPAYVWNKTEEMFSEFGDITVASFGGGITRI